MSIDIEKFLEVLRNSDFFIREIYTHGGCYQLYKVLKVLFPDAMAYTIDMRHVATMIDGELWDIDGVVHEDEERYFPMSEQEMKVAENWSFAKNNDLYYGECPVCEEPIRIDRSKLI